MYSIIPYTTPQKNSPFEDFFAKLLKKHREKDIYAITTYLERLEKHGLLVNSFYHDTIKLIRDDIYELRPRSVRIFFFCFTNNRIVLLHAIDKRRGNVPPAEIKKAIKMKNDHLRRNK